MPYFLGDGWVLHEEEHFWFVHPNVSTEDMNEGKLEYAKFGKVGLNNHVSLSPSNILQRAHQWGHNLV